MKKRTTLWKHTATVLAQVLPVMLGVFLGLWANNWNEERKTVANKDKIITLLIEEINANQADIESVLPYHQSLQDSVSRFWSMQNVNLSELAIEKNFTYWRGTRTINLKRAAYETALTAGLLAEMELEEVKSIVQLYQMQGNYQQVTASHLDNIIALNSQNNFLDYLLATNSFAIDVASTEQFLLENYEETLKVLQQ